MNPSITPPLPSRSVQILKTVLYILAVIVLVPGLIAGISMITGADNLVANAIMPFQLLGSEIINSLLAPTLRGFLINLGIGIVVISLILSALLYGLGRLIGHVAYLEARLARLEAVSLETVDRLD
jgi:hypothetical protein